MAGHTRRPGELPPLPQARDPDPLLGTIIGERYRLVERIGAGGMATVYRAEHMLLKKPLAVKLLLPELVGESDMSARFEGEAIAAARLDHPNCVSITDFGTTAEGRLFLVMEFLEGTPLDEIIGDTGPLGWERAVELTRQMLRGLAHAHDMGIVHRDLKPSNVMVTAHPGGREVAKIIDFGIAKIVSGAPVGPRVETQTGVVFGTADFLAPERLTGKGDSDPRSDLYSVGVGLFEMLTGVRPFHDPDPYVVVKRALTETAQPPSARVEDIPPSLDAVVARALEKDPEQRYATAREFLAALDPFAGRKTTGSLRKGDSFPPVDGSSSAVVTPLPLYQPAPRRRWPWLVAILGVAALTTVLVVLTTGAAQPVSLRPPPRPAVDPEKEIASLVRTAGEGETVADRQAAFDRLVALGYRDRVPWLSMLTRDLAQKPTCEERREVAAQLKKLNDPAALPYIQEAERRPDNGCFQPAAAAPPPGKPAPARSRGGGGGHF